MEYRQGSHTKFKIEYHFVWVTKYRYLYRLPCAARRSCPESTWVGSSNLRTIRDSDFARCCRQRSFPYPGFRTARNLACWYHAESQGQDVSKDFRGIYVLKEAILGATFLGERVFLCHFRWTDERNDSGISGQSFWKRPQWEFWHWINQPADDGVAGLSVRDFKPTDF